MGLVLVFLILGFFALFYNPIEKEKEREEAKKALQAEIQEKKRVAKESSQRLQDSLTAKYGAPAKTINVNKWGEYDIKKYIMIFPKQSIVFIDNKEMSFTDISSFKIIDNYQIKHGQVNGKLDTKTKTGSLVGRSAAGAIIGGGVGAMIGASSAAKTTQVNYSQGNDKVVHDYVLLVGTKSFDEPVIEIRIGDRWKLATEIEMVFNLILERNNQ